MTLLLICVVQAKGEKPKPWYATKAHFTFVEQLAIGVRTILLCFIKFELQNFHNFHSTYCQVLNCSPQITNVATILKFWRSPQSHCYRNCDRTNFICLQVFAILRF